MTSPNAREGAQPPLHLPRHLATGVETIGKGAGSLSCIEGSDPETLTRPTTAQLPYGQAVRLGDVVCVSRQSGVRCENGATLHGFSISRSTYELF